MCILYTYEQYSRIIVSRATILKFLYIVVLRSIDKNLASEKRKIDFRFRQPTRYRSQIYTKNPKTSS